MGKTKVDFKGLEKFAKKLNKLNKEQLQIFSESAIKELAARLLAKVIKRTPVGEYDKPISFIAEIPPKNVEFTTKSGKLVKFTTKAKQKQVNFQPHTGKKGGTLRRGWTIGDVVKTDGGYTIEVINPVEYASYVEFGHRTANHQGWVEGRFMLTISEQELEADAPRILESKLTKFLGDVFNA